MDNNNTRKDILYEQVQNPENVVYEKNNEKVYMETTKSNTSLNSSPANRKFLYVAACVGNLAAYTCGLCFGWTSPEIPLFKQADSPLTEKLTSSQEPWVGSLLPIGAAIGPWIAGALLDRIGRKKSLILSILPFIATFLLSAFATSAMMLFIARFLAGIGVGCVFTVLPMYIGEIAEDEVRGALGSFMQLFITLGLLFSYGFGPYLPIKTFNLACVVVPAAFIFIFFYKIPESPYFLIKSDRTSAEKALMQLRSKNIKQIQQEMDFIQDSVEESTANKANFMDIFKSKCLTKAFILSIGLVSFQQFSGINVVIFYAQDIFTDAGSTLAPEIATILIGVIQVFASALTPVLVEKYGKRFLLILSAIGMTISHGLLAYFFYLKDGGSEVTNISWLPVASLIAYIITYCLGFGPLPWAVLGELFPGNIKSVASTVTASECWFLGFLITNYFSLVVGLIGKSGSFGFFSICCALSGLFVFKYLPETSGKSLAEVQELLSK